MPNTKSTLLRRLRDDAGLLALAACALFVLWGAIGLRLADEHRRSGDAAITNTDNMARAFAENITRSVEAIDQTLLFVRKSYAEFPVFDLKSWAHSSQFLSELTLQISIIGPDGTFLMNQNGPATERVDLSDREHFRVHLPPAPDKLFISKPLLGRVSARWSIQFSRRLNKPDGSFGGVAVISADPYYLSRFYESMKIGSGSVLLAGFDGVVRAAADHNLIGSDLNSLMLSRIVTGAETGSLDVTGANGVPVIYSYRRLERYPLVVAVGLPANEVYADYWRDRQESLVVGAVLTLLVLLITGVMLWQTQRVRGSRQALAGTLENISQGIMMVTPEGRVPVINRRAIELLGLPPELGKRRRLMVRDILDAQVAADDYREEDAQLRDQAAAGTIDFSVPRYERERSNGTVLEVRSQMIEDGGAVRTYTDITDRRRNERALATARDAAEAAGRARAEFLAVMTHEIRTPMNGIIGIAGLLLDMPMDETERQYVRIVRDSGNHLLQLINDILDFSKLDAGRLELEEISFDVRSVLTSAVELLTTDAQSKGLELKLHVAPDVPQRAGGDPGRLRQILLNLIGNGLKFTEKGSVEITVTSLATPAGTTRLSISVRDTGIGIPQEALGRLFTEFNQVDTSISRRFGGSGLGLAICKRLITRMGGSIAVESTPGEGSTFQFDVVLQSRRASDGARGGPVETAIPTGPAWRILVAEDNSTNRLVVTKVLERLGHRVDNVSNGAEAVEAVRTIPYDLVLMDVMMPEMDGLAATRAIRALEEPINGIAIIGLTASALREEEKACLAAGMDLFATKPVTSERLASCIARVMEGRTGNNRKAALGTMTGLTD